MISTKRVSSANMIASSGKLSQIPQGSSISKKILFPVSFMGTCVEPIIVNFNSIPFSLSFVNSGDFSAS
ncbi:hypothetical protein K9O30_02525 [Clostridium bowmanii]|uniref:hypothetical protein n=1 Tax=Clostridium bowmanii TaxID=132925 RepID=UPI001C0DE9FA|nr:hypothetical protein [Clostridium bowmanii]MBU3188248.1 hypothetical protein [Clostridium bowmanii]MCA1072634.1 hypothetical protein [Clostridium bowmanii]